MTRSVTASERSERGSLDRSPRWARDGFAGSPRSHCSLAMTSEMSSRRPEETQTVNSKPGAGFIREKILYVIAVCLILFGCGKSEKGGKPEPLGLELYCGAGIRPAAEALMNAND